MGIGADPLVNRLALGPPSLRAMTERDLDRAAAIEAVSAITPWSVTTFEHELRIPFSRSLVAEVEGRGVVGFVVWWRIAGEVHLLNLAVAPENRRSGLGRALLGEVLEDGRRAGADRVVLEVADDNASALHLYAATGFSTVGRRRNYYGPGRDAVLMARAFPPDDAPRNP